jgi:hypothetical protein
MRRRWPVQAECAKRSTGGAVLAYAPNMRNANFIIPTLFLALFAAPGCKEDPAPNEPGEFGEPCQVGEPDDTANGCVAGHFCYAGYCEENCAAPTDCQPIEGWEHGCAASGVCHVFCSADKECPQDLGTPLTCDNAGLYCEAEKPD